MTRILAVDDSKAIRQMVAATLQADGYDVTTADDGSQGLEIAEQESFDLVISDVNMPIVGGYEFVRSLRSNDAYRHTPVLMLTTEFEDHHKKTGREAGASGWIIKPIDPDKLIKAVRRVTS
ncbi:MAG: response regulator [Pseudomonadales bacterium]